MKLHIIIYQLILLLLITGCQSLKVTESATFDPIPEMYPGQKDSTNSASISWKKYFQDQNLVSLIDTALDNNLDLLSAKQRIEAAQSRIKFVKGFLLPSININTSAAQRKYGLYTMDGAGNITTDITPGRIVPIHLKDFYVGLQTSWEIDLWGKLHSRKKAAVARYLATQEGKNLITTTLIADIAKSYFELQALDSQLEIIRETIKLQEEAYAIVQIQKEAAAANDLAVRQFEAQLLASRSLEREVLQSITEVENTINFLTGRFPQPVKRDIGKFTDSLPFLVQVGIPMDLFKNRPDIRQAEQELIASRADLRAARAAFYPSLNITGGYGFQAFSTKFLFNTPQSIAYGIVGGLTAPLINRSAIKAEFRNSNAVQLEALYNYQKTILNAYIEVYNELIRIENLTAIRNFNNTEVEVLNRSIETSSDLFKSGRANYIEVLMTQRNALDSKLKLVDTKRRQYFSMIDIYKALGGGWQ